MTDILKTLAAQRAQIEAKLAEEKAAHDYFALEDAQGNQDAQRSLEESEKKIRSLELQLQRNDSAVRQAEARQTAEGAARVRADTTAAAERAVHFAVERAQMAHDLDEAFATAGRLLKKWGATTREITAHLRAVVEGAEGLGDRQRRDLLEQIGPAARGPEGAALKSAITSNGFGAAEGIFEDEVHSISRPSKQISFTDAAELSADKVAVTVRRLVGVTK